MGRKELPEHGRPLKEDVGNIERIEHPRPLRRVKMECLWCPGCLSIADVATVKIRQDIETAHNGQNAAVELVIS